MRTLDERPAARTINKNKGRILEHLVQVLSEWIVASIEPAKELTRTKEPEFLFLHTKDFWFRSIWIDLHQALTIDRESSRDRAPIGLVSARMIMSKANMLMSSSSSATFMRLYPFGWLPLCSGIFASLQRKAHHCLFLVNLTIEKDGLLLSPKKQNQAKHSAEFKRAIEYWAESGLLKPDVWKARRTNLSLTVKLEIPVSGTAIQVQQ